MLRRYKVWDPINDDSDCATDVVADTPESAAESYAENDTSGQRDGVYAPPEGYPLHVRACDDDDDCAWEVRVAVEHTPIAGAVRSGRLV